MIQNHLISLSLSLAYASSVVDPIRQTLDADSARLFRGVWISGIVVAIGCMFEVWEIAHDLRNWKRARKEKELLKDNPGSWMYPMAALGLFLVIGGIVSETIFEVLDANVESQYRVHESDKITAAEGEAAAATRQAGNAATNAKIAQDSAAGATLDIKQAKNELDSFHDQIVSAQKEAMKAESNFQNELLRTRRLEQQTGWRTVTPEQKSSMRKRFLEDSPTPLKGLTINIEYLENDNEAHEYADEIKDALDGLGAKINDPTAGNLIRVFPNGQKHLLVGVGYSITEPTSKEEATQNFFGALNWMWIGMMPIRDESIPEHEVKLYIGMEEPHGNTITFP